MFPPAIVIYLPVKYPAVLDITLYQEYSRPLTDVQNDILRSSEDVQPQVTWRNAVEAWLRMKGLLR